MKLKTLPTIDFARLQQTWLATQLSSSIGGLQNSWLAIRLNRDKFLHVTKVN